MMHSNHLSHVKDTCNNCSQPLEVDSAVFIRLVAIRAVHEGNTFLGANPDKTHCTTSKPGLLKGFE
jgi:hypothetical protein